MPPSPTALLLTCTGSLAEIDLPFGRDGRSSADRSAVLRCERFDVVALTTQWDMWIDDDGLHSHPVNVAATALARRFGFVFQLYHGPVLLTGSPDAEGNTLPLLKEQVLGLLRTLQDI
ncbi:DUF3846 domain-containing protein [Streptomyces sp. NPDC001935]